MCQRYLHKCNVRLFEHEKYHTLNAELYCPVKSFDEKIHISSTYHKHLSRNEMPLSNSFNEIGLDPIPDELEEYLKIAIKHGQGESAKTKGIIYNIPTEAVNICNILLRATD